MRKKWRIKEPCVVNKKNTRHLCSPLKILEANIYSDETYLSTIPQKKKEQAWLP